MLEFGRIRTRGQLVDAIFTLVRRELFRPVVISAEIGINKLDPAIFAIAIDKLGVKPEHAWRVTDNLRRDVEGAKAAGLTAVWLNRGGLRRASRRGRCRIGPAPSAIWSTSSNLTVCFSALRCWEHQHSTPVYPARRYAQTIAGGSSTISPLRKTNCVRSSTTHSKLSN